jgi:hypothetical protein
MNITEIMHNLENLFGLMPLRSTYLYRNGHITEMPRVLQYSLFHNESNRKKVSEFLTSKSYYTQYGYWYTSESLPAINLTSIRHGLSVGQCLSLGDNLERMLFSRDIQDCENLIVYLNNKLKRLKEDQDALWSHA